MAAPARLQHSGSGRGSNRSLSSRDFCQVPVTGLALYREPSSGSLHVLAAEDTHLAVYDGLLAGRPPRCRFPVFAEQPIHGLHVEGGRVLAWGSNHVALFSTDGLDRGAVPSLVARGEAPDWIYGGALSPYDGSRAVLVTAHNEAVDVKQDPTDETRLLMGDAVSPSRPILSAAHLSWLSKDCILVGGGTFFGEILVWAYHLDRTGEDAHEMRFILTGHEGSIFGMDISQVMTLDDGSTVRFLASCSDDRTVRIWDVTDSSTNSQKTAIAQARLREIRETGFVSSETASATDGNNNDPKPVTMTMGHISRIWGVRFAAQQDNARSRAGIMVYSFGEDSTAQKWHLKFASQAASGAGNGEGTAARLIAGSISHKYSFTLHDGKNLWSSALMDIGDKIFIATGGADGKISLINDEPVVEPQSASTQASQSLSFPSNRVITFEVRDLLASISTPRTMSGRKEEIINRYDFISGHEILSTTSWGRLLLGTFERGLQWQEVAVDEPIATDLKQCYVLRRFGAGTAMIGTSSGNVYFYGAGPGLVHVAKLPGKVVDVCCLNNSSPPGPQSGEDAIASGELLIFLFGSSVGHYFVLDPTTGSIRNQEQVHDLDSRFVAVSASRIGEYIVLGSRSGYLSIVKRVEGVYRQVLNMATPSRDAISAMVPIPSRGTEAWPNSFVATSRDGRYRIYRMEVTTQGLRLCLCHETSLPFGPFIEGAWFTRDAEPQLILYGFRSKDLVIWNETTREELATVECGGAHRTFTLLPNSVNPGSFRFAFTKTSRLSVYRQEGARHTSIRTGIHGREIRTISYNGRYLATGAEDTTVRVWDYEAGGEVGAALRPLASIKAHVSGIQRIRWLGEDYLLSSGGNEEFFVWKIHELDAGYKGIGIVREGVLTDKSNDADLRITDFDVCRLDDDDGIIVTLAYSNTVLKTYRYQPGGGSFKLIAKGAYTGACLTQVRHLGRWGEDSFSVLTASTDGHLATWKLQGVTDGDQSYSMQAAICLHQSSVKSLDMTAVPGGYRVLTGGDDNAIGMAFIARTRGVSSSPGVVYKVEDRRIVRDAHAASINGVLMLPHDEAGITAISISNDQRIKTWRLPEAKEDTIKLLGNVYSGVADPGDVELLGQGRTILLGGVGLESWEIHNRIVD